MSPSFGLDSTSLWRRFWGSGHSEAFTDFVVALPSNVVFKRSIVGNKFDVIKNWYMSSNPNVKNVVLDVWEAKALAVPSDASYDSHQAFYMSDDRHHFEGAWDTTKGSGVEICVIDSGVDLQHEEFASMNLLEAYDFTENDADVSPTFPTEFHGTAVLSVIAAAHNDVGVAGGAPDAAIRYARALRGSTSTGASSLLNAVEFCIDNGSDIISASIGFDSTPMGPLVEGEFPEIEAKMSNFVNNGGVVVWGAGNGASYRLNYPFYSEDGVIFVSASGANTHELAGYSDFGFLIDVSAFGGDSSNNAPLLAAYPRSEEGVSQYRGTQGTSFATPLTASYIALMKSVHPLMTNKELSKLMQLGKITNPREDKEKFGNGEINAFKGVEEANRIKNNPESLFLSDYAPVLFADDNRNTFKLNINMENADTLADSVLITSSSTHLVYTGASDKTSEGFVANFTASSTDTGLENLTINFSFNGDTFSLDVDLLTQVGSEAYALAFVGDLALYAKSGNDVSLVKKMNEEDIVNNQFSLSNVNIPAGTDSILVAFDTDGDEILCESFEICSDEILFSSLADGSNQVTFALTLR